MSDTRLELAIPADHPAYAGHFPGQPILPGVVLLDAALDALAAAAGAPGAPCRIKSAKFLSPVTPGEPLSLDYGPAPAGGFRFALSSGARTVASGVVEFADAAG